MPRSRNANSYPTEFGKLIQRAFLGETVHIQYPSYKRAKSMQGTLYGFLTAVKANPDEFLHLLQAANQVSCSVEGNPKTSDPATLVVYNKENSWQAASIREALGLEKMSDEMAASAQATLDRLSAPEFRSTPTDQPFDYGSGDAGETVRPTSAVEEAAKAAAATYLGRQPRS